MISGPGFLGCPHAFIKKRQTMPIILTLVGFFCVPVLSTLSRVQHNSNSRSARMQEQSCIIEELPADEEPAASIQQEECSTPTAGTSAPAETSTAAAEEAQLEGPSTDFAAYQAASGTAEPSTASPASETGPSSSSSSPPEQDQQQQQQPADTVQVQQLLGDCERLKEEGNAAYTRGEYDEALQLYWQVRAWPSTTAWAVT